MEKEKRSFKEMVKDNKEKIIKVGLTILGTLTGAAVVGLLVKGSGDASDLIDVECTEVSDDTETHDDSTEESVEE